MRIEYRYDGANKCVVANPNATQNALVREWVDRWNASPEKFNYDKDFFFYLAYHPLSGLLNGNNYLFDQDAFINKPNSDKPNNGLLPIVHLVLFDVFDDCRSSADSRALLTAVNRYKEILDSSIWNYYVPLEIKANGTWEYCDNFGLFSTVLKEIAHNTQLDLYKLAISHEYADLNARLVEQSYLNGAHSSISPFVFHSERVMRERILGMKMGEGTTSLKVMDKIKEFKWRFLLVDDKGVEGLKLSNNEASEIPKLKIVFDAFTRILKYEPKKLWFRSFDNNNVCVDFGNSLQTDVYPTTVDEVQVVVDCVPNIKTAEERMKLNEYEVILLDYLLENEYGYDLLEDLREWKKMNSNRPDDKLWDGDYLIGPNKRCFFLFISAFTTAVQERLLEKGYNKSVRKLWYIGDGACPTNTPYLFAYQLLLRMEHRINDLSKETEGNNITIIELLKNIYCKQRTEVRKAAHDGFNYVLFMRDKYRKLEDDLTRDDEKAMAVPNAKYLIEMRSSLLVYDAFRLVHHFSGAFFEHLQHLVYLTAFGTIRQWEDMWEEFIFVRDELEKYDSLNGKKKRRKEGMQISNAIRDYIINLKENSF